jgi:hypothetical protein
MKPINTFYNGDYFRSRLEARWAVFFTKLNIKYIYEPEGFVSKKGETYLPDFYLPDTYLRDDKGLYIEIKNINHEIDNIKCAEWFDRNIVLFRGKPIDNLWNDGGSYNGFQCFPNWDDNMLFWICDNCKTTKIEYYEGNYNDCPNCKKGKCNENKLYEIALDSSMTRFEHFNK